MQDHLDGVRYDRLAMLLARFLDGTERTCEPLGHWRSFSETVYILEWCAGRAGEETVVLVRMCEDDGPIIGATVANDEVTERDARRLFAAYGEQLSGRRKQTLSRPVRRSEAPARTAYPYSLARLGFVSDQDVTSFLSQQYRVPTIDLSAYLIAPEIIALVPRERCSVLGVLPVSRAGSSLIVAMADPDDRNAIDALKRETGFTIEPVIASETAIRAAIRRYYGDD